MSTAYDSDIKNYGILKDCPCKKDCPERTWDCKKSCKRFKKWDTKHRSDRDKNGRDSTHDGDRYERDKAFRSEKGKRNAQWKIRGKI